MERSHIINQMEHNVNPGQQQENWIVGEQTDWQAEVAHLLANGRKIRAIKVYRQNTEASLREAKEVVEAIELGVPHKVHEQSTLKPVSPYEISLSTREEVESLLSQGSKINAIKAYREATRASLKEAKEAVEQIEREMREYNPDYRRQPERADQARSSFTIFLIIIIFLLFFFFFISMR